ncbi:MAG TPA: 4-hydroxythreonine-4-phosphate dehydrogenase, partial [Caulobacteraceae bacterium]|nr:4-hydroxythreonine-4-phosphate dehydrogenase [Caulobacteraceae bacterium]
MSPARPGSAPLAITLGDPAGVGPEIIGAAWKALRREPACFFLVGDAATCVSAGVPVALIAAPAEAEARFADALPVLDIPLTAPVTPGQPSSAAAPQVIAWIERAVSLALAGEA